jgi:iron complex transport system substrate-binding protein
MKKTLSLIFCLLFSILVLAYEPVTVNFTHQGKDYEITYTKSPERAVTLSHFTTEMFLALNLEEKMAGTAWADNEILPELKTAYDKIPILSDRYPSKEIFLSVNPDFVTGWHSALTDKNVGSVETLIQMDIKPLIIKSVEPDATLETVYEDFITIGKIFDIEDRAQKLVKNMQNEINDVRKKVPSNVKKVKVLAYDSGKDSAFVVCSGLGGSLIQEAGGINIFGNIQKAYANVSWEKVAQSNPDIVLIVDYGSTTYEQKVQFLKENPATKDLDAVKNNKFVKIGLADLSPGIRNINAITTMTKGFYPEIFKK